MNSVKETISLYFVMGSPNCLYDPSLVLEEAILGGITMFQFREKGIESLQGLDKKKLAIKLQDICKDSNIPFIVNDDVELALEIDADGVHIGQEDQPIEVVRQKIGSKILGVSAHNVEEAKIATQLGADYLGVGPMYATTTKSDIREIKGPRIIEEIRRSNINIPIVGIGGITTQRVHEVLRSGADGVAVITAISLSKQPKQAANEIRIKIDNSLKSYN